MGGERIVHVGDAQNASTHGNCVAAHPVWVTGPIPTFVMVADHRQHVPRELDVLEQVGSSRSMRRRTSAMSRWTRSLAKRRCDAFKDWSASRLRWRVV